MRFNTTLKKSGLPCYWFEQNNGQSGGDRFDNANEIIDDFMLSCPKKDIAAIKPLYDDGRGYVNDPEIVCGQHLYSLFDRTIVLGQVMRQAGDDERSRLFRETLAELRDYGPDGISDRALQFLRSRVKSRLLREEVRRFDDALHILLKRKDVKEHNLAGQRDTWTPA
jgi:hypothetical protein